MGGLIIWSKECKLTEKSWNYKSRFLVFLVLKIMEISLKSRKFRKSRLKSRKFRVFRLKMLKIGQIYLIFRLFGVKIMEFKPIPAVFKQIKEDSSCLAFTYGPNLGLAELLLH